MLATDGSLAVHLRFAFGQLCFASGATAVLWPHTRGPSHALAVRLRLTCAPTLVHLWCNCGALAFHLWLTCCAFAVHVWSVRQPLVCHCRCAFAVHCLAHARLSSGTRLIHTRFATGSQRFASGPPFTCTSLSVHLWSRYWSPMVVLRFARGSPVVCLCPPQVHGVCTSPLWPRVLHLRFTADSPLVHI